MKKTLLVLILLMILPIISYATEIYLSGQRPPSYPHDARMIGKLELTRAD